MSHLSILADALLFLGKSIDPQSVTKVRFGLEHSPSDIGLGVWKFKATLQGQKGIDDSGSGQVSFEQTWEGTGDTDEEAIKDSFKAIQDHIQGFHYLRETETSFAEQALLTLTGSPALPALWATQDPQSMGDPAQDSLTLAEATQAMTDMAEEAGSPNGQSSSV
jgi:hypothetical protein